MSMSSTRRGRFACKSLPSALYKYRASLCSYHPSRENTTQSIANMVMSKSPFLVLIVFLLLSFGLLSSAACANARRTEHDPREKYEKCQRRCEWETRGEREQEECEQKCERQFKEQQRQQEERQHGRGLNPEDPQRKYEECQQRCEQQAYRQRPQCQERCDRQYQEQQRQQQEEPQRQYQECQQRCQEKEQGQKEQCQRQCREQYEQGRDADEDSYHHHKKSWSQEEEGEEEGQQRNNPYYFPYRRSFQTRFRNEEGNFKVLQRFAEKSPLLKGINDFRLAIFEVNPLTFVLPHHCDYEAIYFVTNGKGTITFVSHENRESYNVEFGTALRIPVGSTVYMVNQDNNEKLRIAVFAQPVNAPGKFVEFFPAGNGDPSSYLQVFSYELLETVFNTPREKLEQVFQTQRGQQRQGRRQGVFRRVQPEQIRSMGQQASSPRRGMERLAFNLMSQSPLYSNQNGRFYEASPEEFKQLQNMDVAVAATKINEGAIFVPHYNSRATYLVLVTEGSGYVEMACPHLSRQSQGYRSESEEEEEEEERSGEYQKVRARLSTGDVFVVPAGHPVTFFAPKNQNLRTINFGINAQNNQRIFVAGKKNLMRQMDSEAKQISFGAPSRLVDEVFNNPQESYFMSFSQQRQREDERRGSPLASFLDFTRLF